MDKIVEIYRNAPTLEAVLEWFTKFVTGDFEDERGNSDQKRFTNNKVNHFKTVSYTWFCW